MVPREQGVLFKERVAQVVRGVAGRMYGFQRPVAPFDTVAVAHANVGNEIPVGAFFDLPIPVRAPEPWGPNPHVGAPVASFSGRAAGEWSQWV